MATISRKERRAAKAEARKNRPITAVHESGHAVARYLTAELQGYAKYEAISHIDCDSGLVMKSDGTVHLIEATTYGPMFSRPIQEALLDSGGGHINDAHISTTYMVKFREAGIDVRGSAQVKALVCVAGPIAEAIYRKKNINAVLASDVAKSDVDCAIRECKLAGMTDDETIDCYMQAAALAKSMFACTGVWNAVRAMARQMPSSGRMEGQHCANIIQAAIGDVPQLSKEDFAAFECKQLEAV